PDLIAGVESVIRRSGGHLLLRSTEQDQSRELHLLDALLAQRPSALVVAPTLFGVVDPDAYLRRLNQLRLPLVVVERVPDGRDGRQLSYVATDTWEGARLAVEHLSGLGRRRVGLLSPRNTATSEQVLAGFRAAVVEHGLNSDRAIVRRAGWSERDLADYAARVRELGLDGLMCLGDRVAERLLPHLRRVGISVPQDVAVVAYEDEVARHAEIPLTAVVPPRFEVGRMAGDLVLRAMDLGAETPTARVALMPRLVVRASTRPTS